MAAQIITQVIIIGSRVFQGKTKQNLEFFNELILMLVLYTMLCFSPFVHDVNVKFYLGYVSIAIVALHLLINLSFIFKGSYDVVRNKCR